MEHRRRSVVGCASVVVVQSRRRKVITGKLVGAAEQESKEEEEPAAVAIAIGAKDAHQIAITHDDTRTEFIVKRTRLEGNGILVA